MTNSGVRGEGGVTCKKNAIQGGSDTFSHLIMGEGRAGLVTCDGQAFSSEGVDLSEPIPEEQQTALIFFKNYIALCYRNQS